MNSTHERPILFSGPMVRALLDGSKTMTRRLFFALVGDRPVYGKGYPRKPRCCAWEGTTDEDGWPLALPLGGKSGDFFRVPSPHGVPGDRLWVRETMRLRDAGKRSEAWTYAADDAEVSLPKGDPRIGAMLAWAHHKEGNACVSIHMPRWASRIDLEVTAVRVERLQSITEEDALAEGLRPLREQGLRTIGQPGWQWGDGQGEGTRDAFSVLWDDINGTKAPWAANPWVWVVSFRRVRPA